MQWIIFTINLIFVFDYYDINFFLFLDIVKL